MTHPFLRSAAVAALIAVLPHSAGAFVPSANFTNQPQTNTAPVASVLILADKGSHDGAGHDRNDDHGGRGAGSDHDDGSDHDANDDHGQDGDHNGHVKDDHPDDATGGPRCDGGGDAQEHSGCQG